MSRVYTLICIGCISLIGFSAHAQQGAVDPVENIAEILETLTFDESLLVIETPATDVEQSVAETVDSKTNRYLPRLRIDFSEFPLRTLAETNRSGRGTNGEVKSRVESIVQRIQVRLRAPDLGLVVKDRVATISGTVATERQRNLAETMLRFEPGIDAVQNEIAIAVAPEQ